MINFQGWNTIETKMTIACMMIIYISMTFNIFIFCYIGETVTEQVKNINYEIKILCYNI